MEEKIAARLAELKAARAAYLAEAQRQLMGFDAAIGELEALRGVDEASRGAGYEPVEISTREG